MIDPRQPLAVHHVLWLLLSLALITTPHAARLPWWIVALVATLGTWRAYIAYGRHALPNRWLLLLIVIVATIGIYLNYRTIFGRDAGVALLVVMLGLKLLEMRSLRDAMLLIFLGYFLVITNFLYSQTIPSGLYMLACVWIITATMMSLHYGREEPPFGRQLRIGGVLLAQSVPLMLVLFLLFPRVSGPLWGLPQDAYSGVSGLSNMMTPGSISNLILSDAVAFRVKFDSEIPPAKQRYWRGPVMSDFDGQTWSASRFIYGSPQFTKTGKPINYEVTLEPHNKRWLFALDLPARAVPHSATGADFQIRSFSPVNNRMRYEMASFLDYSYGTDENSIALHRALQLPAEFNPRAVQLARTLRRKFPDDRMLVREVLAIFRNQNFFYTLSPPLLGRHSVDEFLFNTRRGFCEHYASAFAVLMRAAGIPSRVVTGYLGGEVNELGDYLIVRQADAHAWTEIWFADVGWVRVDPTAAVSPLRVEAGISAAIPRGEPLPILVRGDFAALRQLRFTWDLIANTWNQWVLGYTPERQRRLLIGMGIDDSTWYSLTVIMLALAGLIVVILATLMLRRLKVRAHDPVRKAYLHFCDKLRRRGLPCAADEGPVDYAHRLERVRPDLALPVGTITQLYVMLRYGAETSSAALQELRQRVKQFSA
jgi:transglutaminase-like putative cysteine protease